MAEPSFIETHALRDAFFGYRLGRLFDLLMEQGDDFMRAEGVSFPSRANSTVLYISEHNGASTADIMRELQQPHQLVAQRIDLLMELGVVERLDDPNDKRRKILRLTRKGKKEAALLRNAMRDAIRAFERLFDEIDVEMDEAVRSMTKALADASIGERVKAVRTRKRRAA